MINKTASRLDLPEVFKIAAFEKDSDFEEDEIAENEVPCNKLLLNDQPSIDNFMTEATKA